jgi:hypothetical protein
MLQDVNQLLDLFVVAGRQQLLRHALNVERRLLALVVDLVIEAPDNVRREHLRRLGRVLGILPGSTPVL